MQNAIGICQRRYHKTLDGMLSIPLMCPTSGSYPYGERIFNISSGRFSSGPKLLNICYKDNSNKKHTITHYDIKNQYYDTADFTMRIYPNANDSFVIPVIFRVELNTEQKIGGSLSYSDLNIRNDEDVINFSKQFNIFQGKSTSVLPHILDTLFERSGEKILNGIAREIQEECTPYGVKAYTIANIRNMIEYDTIRIEIDKNDITHQVEKYIVTFLFNHKHGIRPFRKVREIDEFSMIYNGSPMILYYTYCSRNQAYNKCYKSYPGFNIPDEQLILNEYNMFDQRPLYINGKVAYNPPINNFVNYGSYTAPTAPVSSFININKLSMPYTPVLEYMNNSSNEIRRVSNIPSITVKVPRIPVKVIYNNEYVNNANNSNTNNEVIGPRVPVRIPSVIRRRGKSPRRASNTTRRGLTYNAAKRNIGMPIEQYIPAAARNTRKNNRRTVKK
jgi:hypothetical protein